MTEHDIAAPTTLAHNQRVRLAAWDSMSSASVLTVEGYAKENGLDVEAQIARSISNRWDLATTIQSGAALVGGPGRFAYYDRVRAEAATAVTLAPGQLVEIEGRRYTVLVVPGNERSPRNSDPIHFKATKT